MTKHNYTLQGNIYMLADSADELLSKNPTFAMFGFVPTGSDWVYVQPYKHTVEVDLDRDKAIALTVSAIDAEIAKKRVELEDTLQDLRDRKANLLSLTYSGEA